MTVVTAQTSLSHKHPASVKHHRRHRTGLRRFLRTSALFLVGLVVCLALAEWLIGRNIRRTMARGMLGGVDVYRAKHQAKRDAPHAKAIFIGDSVARQLFLP